MTADSTAVWISTVVGALALVGAFLKWIWPGVLGFFRALSLTFETINGKPAEYDKSGAVVHPPEPSLRVQLSELKDTVADQGVQNLRITAIEDIQAQHARMLADHSERFSRLDAGHQIERIVTKTESQQAWAAVEAIAKQEDKNA